MNRKWSMFLKTEVKGLFIKTRDGLLLEDIAEIAKAEAVRIGFVPDRNLVKVAYGVEVPSLGGWLVAIQKKV